MKLMAILPLTARAPRLRARLLAAAAAFGLLALPAFAAPPPEPEPDDGNYLRACDAYGDGYFSIPGTDTCLKLSGHVRGDAYGGNSVTSRKMSDYSRKSASWLGRGAIELSTMSDTKYGPLHTYIKFGSTWQDGAETTYSYDLNAGNGQLGFAYIELGGLRVGLNESIFDYWTGYYGSVLNDNVLGVSQSRTNGVSYTLNLADGFSAIIGAEQGNTSGADNISYFDEQTQQFTTTNTPGGFRFGRDGRKIYRRLSTESKNYLPNFAAGVKYEQKWGSVASVLGYDSYDSELAAKLRVDVNITDKLSVFAMGAYKTMGDYYNYDTSYGNNGIRIKGSRADGSPIYRYGIYRQLNAIYGDWGGHIAGWVGASYQLNAKTSLNLEEAADATNSFYSTANLTRVIVNGLILSMEVSFINWNDKTSYRNARGDMYETSLRGKQAIQSEFRLERDF